MGPYIVVRQTGPSNYLVKRQRGECSKEDTENAKENEEESYSPVTQQPVSEEPPPSTSQAIPINTEIWDLPLIIQQTETQHDGPIKPTERQTKRPQRKKNPPQRFLALIPLIILSVCIAPSAQVEPNTVIERGGVYFRHLVQVAMCDSEWTRQDTTEFSHGNKDPPPPIDS